MLTAELFRVHSVTKLLGCPDLPGLKAGQSCEYVYAEEQHVLVIP
jgi:hypothetical protein